MTVCLVSARCLSEYNAPFREIPKVPNDDVDTVLVAGWT